MRVYRHFEDPNRLIIDVTDSVIMYDILMASEYASEMEYDPDQHWFSVSVETYKKLRDRLSNAATPFFREQPTKKRIATPAPPKEQSGPPPTPVFAAEITPTRTVSTQTNMVPIKITHDRCMQTESMTDECVAEKAQENEQETSCPPISYVIPVPPVPETTIPSPSMAMIPIIHDDGTKFVTPQNPPTSNYGRMSTGQNMHGMPAPAASENPPSLRSGYTDWKDVCLRRLAIRDMLLQHNHGFFFKHTKRNPGQE